MSPRTVNGALRDIKKHKDKTAVGYVHCSEVVFVMTLTTSEGHHSWRQNHRDHTEEKYRRGKKRTNSLKITTKIFKK